MKVGIVVPYSWSFWGAVVEHAELQADALRRRGIDTRTIMGNDPPGSFTRVLHPRLGRHGHPPPDVIPVGRSVIVPANGSLPNIVLSPRTVFRMRRALERERFDVLHLHEPRKGLHVLLRAWREISRLTGARLRIVGADPLAVRLLLTRERIPEDAIDVLGFLSQEELTRELLRSKLLVAPSLGGESFGMVLTRAFACATPVVASDIDGYREVMTKEAGVSFSAGDEQALTEAVAGLLEDEPRRAALGEGARRIAVERYSWDDIARRLVEIYDQAAGAA